MSIEWAVKGQASVLVDGQFGSTGKGLIAAYLADRFRDVDVATTAAGAQAGHTTKWRSGKEYICFHLPTHGVECRGSLAYINAGAIVHVPTLLKEINDCGIDIKRIVVHPRAAVILDEHQEAERSAGSSTQKLASTMKGVGAALSDKIWRRSPLIAGTDLDETVRVGAMNLNAYCHDDAAVVIETPQGTGLGLNHGFNYPACTSRDCIVSSALDYAAVHPAFLGPVCMVIRTYPIRVGHVTNEYGEKLGDSGPFYPDSIEMDWGRDFPGIEPERTTVTKRVRRIATFSFEQYADALMLNRPTIVAINFCNYLPSAVALLSMMGEMRRIELGLLGYKPNYLFGFSAYCEDVTDDIDAAVAWYDKRGK